MSKTTTKKRQKKLAEAGWQDTSIAEFLGLTDEEERYIHLKVALVQLFKTIREHQGLTQTEAAKQIGSSQSRVAMMEGGDPSVSVDRVLKALLALGASNQEIGEQLLQAA